MQIPIVSANSQSQGHSAGSFMQIYYSTYAEEGRRGCQGRGRRRRQEGDRGQRCQRGNCCQGMHATMYFSLQVFSRNVLGAPHSLREAVESAGSDHEAGGRHEIQRGGRAVQRRQGQVWGEFATSAAVEKLRNRGDDLVYSWSSRLR